MMPSPTKLVLLYTIIQIVPDVFPMPAAVFHSQSQEGEYNVRADFKDIAIILMPTKEIVDLGINMAIGKSNGNVGRQIGVDRIKSKYGFVRPEKSPYKVDLEKSNVPLTKVDSIPEAQQTIKTYDGIDDGKKTVKKDLQLANEAKQDVQKKVPLKMEQNEKEVVKDDDVKKEQKEMEVVKVDDLEKEHKEKEVVKDVDVKKEQKETDVVVKIDDVKKENSKIHEKKKEDIKIKVDIADKKKADIKKDDQLGEKKKEDVDVKKDEKKKEGQPEKTTKGMKMMGEDSGWILVQEGLEECGPDGHRNEEGICVFMVAVQPE